MALFHYLAWKLINLLATFNNHADSVVASDVGSRPAGVELVPAGDSGALAAALLGERAAPAGVTAADSIERILALYQGEAACAASAVS